MAVAAGGVQVVAAHGDALVAPATLTLTLPAAPTVSLLARATTMRMVMASNRTATTQSRRGRPSANAGQKKQIARFLLILFSPLYQPARDVPHPLLPLVGAQCWSHPLLLPVLLHLSQLLFGDLFVCVPVQCRSFKPSFYETSVIHQKL